MKLVVTHETALHYLRLQRDGVRRRSLAPGELYSPRNDKGTPRRFFDVTELPDEMPLHIAVPERGQRAHNTPNLVCHALDLDRLPARSFVPVAPEVLAASPELVFVQMAGKLPLVPLVELGFELCGGYARTADDRGFADAKPLTSTKRLGEYVAGCEGMYGAGKARRAVVYVADGAASPMEAAVAMLLTLPSHLGGYGFDKPQLNGEVAVPSRLRRDMGVDALHCDLLWPECGVALEYDSDRYHTGAERIFRDAERRNNLKKLGVEVVAATRRQVLDMYRFEKVAGLLARAMGRRLRIRSSKFERARSALYAQLFARNRLVP